MRFTPRSEIPPAVFLNDPDEVAQLCERYSRMDGPIGFDTETSGLDFDGLLVDSYVVGLCTHDHRVAISTYESGCSEILRTLSKFLPETQDRHCGWNVQYDWNVLYGYTKYGFGWSRPIELETCWADGMKLFCLFDEEGEDTYGNRRLKDRARHWLGLPMNDFDSIAQKMGFRWAMSENRDLAIDYATRDAWAHMGLCMLGQKVTESMPWCMACPECGSYCYEQDPRKKHEWKCIHHGWVSGGQPLTMWDWHVRRDIPFLKLLQRMQIRGTPMDWAYLEESIQPLEMALEQKKREFYRVIGDAFYAKYGVRRAFNINLNSHDQLRVLYHGTYDRDGNPCGFGFKQGDKTDTGNASMGKKSLQKLMAVQQAPGVLQLLEFRKLDKILSTYVRGIIERRFPFDDNLHGIFRPWTTTGRLLSRDPNMQNFPTRDVVVMLPPAAPYVPTIEEMTAGNAEGWGMSLEEAEEELAQPQYQEREMRVNIRRAVKAPKGFKILCADYSQLEIRLTAHESRCEALIKVLKDGLDMHCYAAARAFESALNGVGYDEIYEAKQWDDGDTGPRHLELFKLAEPGQAERILQARLQGLLPAEKPRAMETLAKVASMRARWDGTEDGFGEFVQNSNPELYLEACGLLGTRDYELLNLRKSAKSAIFGIIYGIGPTGLAVQITEATRKPCTVKEARSLIESIRDVVFPGIGRMINRQKHTLRTKGYVRTGMLRYRHPAGIYSGDHGKRARAERQASNSPIQGLAADVVMAAMLAIEVDAQMNAWGCSLFSQVHDELLVLVPEEFADVALERLKLLMEISHGVDTPVPLTATGHAADTWDEAK